MKLIYTELYHTFFVKELPPSVNHVLCPRRNSVSVKVWASQWWTWFCATPKPVTVSLHWRTRCWHLWTALCGWTDCKDDVWVCVYACVFGLMRTPSCWEMQCGTSHLSLTSGLRFCKICVWITQQNCYNFRQTVGIVLLFRVKLTLCVSVRVVWPLINLSLRCNNRGSLCVHNDHRIMFCFPGHFLCIHHECFYQQNIWNIDLLSRDGKNLWDWDFFRFIITFDQNDNRNVSRCQNRFGNKMNRLWDLF